MEASIGRIVHYRLSEMDAEAINRRRADYQDTRRRRFDPTITQRGTGEQVHVGNVVEEGDVFPAMVVRIWPYGASVQLQVFLDGNDTFWATSVNEGDGVRQWSWPPRV